ASLLVGGADEVSVTHHGDIRQTQLRETAPHAACRLKGFVAPVQRKMELRVEQVPSHAVGDDVKAEQHVLPFACFHGTYEMAPDHTEGMQAQPDATALRQHAYD